MRNLILYFIILIFCVKKENCKISELPKKLKIGYASWGECDELIYEAVENGLNVVIWFSLDIFYCSKTNNSGIINRRCWLRSSKHYCSNRSGNKDYNTCNNNTSYSSSG